MMNGIDDNVDWDRLVQTNILVCLLAYLFALIEKKKCNLRSFK